MWPLVHNASHNFEPMKTQGYLVKCPSENNECHPPEYPLFCSHLIPFPYFPNFTFVSIFALLFSFFDMLIYVYDPTNPAARQFVWDQVYKGYFQNGIQTFWLDADEPETFSSTSPPSLLVVFCYLLTSNYRLPEQDLFDWLARIRRDDVSVLPRTDFLQRASLTEPHRDYCS